MKLGRQKLLGSVRGTGALRVSGRTFSVRYELDRFSDRQGQRASGSVDGDLGDLAAAGEQTAAMLILEDGAEISVLVSEASEAGADIESFESTPTE